MLSVLDGEALWNAKAGDIGQILRRLPRRRQDQHEGRRRALSGLRANVPAARSIWSSASTFPRQKDQQAKPLRLREQGHAGALGLCRDAVARRADRAATTTRASPRSSTRAAPRSTRAKGQLNLSCAQCHDDNWGKHLAGNIVPQGHPTGYPVYRLEWQSLGSLQRRLRNCMIGMRAESYPYGAPEYVDMELFLMWRARGMKMETPGVRP